MDASRARLVFLAVLLLLASTLVWLGRASGSAVLLKPDIGSVSSLGVTAAGTVYVTRDATTTNLQLAPIDLEQGRLGVPTPEHLRGGLPDWSRDGRTIAYMCGTASGVSRLCVRSVESRELHEKSTDLRYFPMPTWMPAMRSLVAWGWDDKGRNGIYQLDSVSGKASFLVDSARSSHRRVDVSPDGSKIYYLTAPNRVVERDLGSGQVRNIVLPPTAGDAKLSPDGRFFATVSSDPTEKSARVIVVPVAGGLVREVARAAPGEALSRPEDLEWTPDSGALLIV